MHTSYHHGQIIGGQNKRKKRKKKWNKGQVTEKPKEIREGGSWKAGETLDMQTQANDKA